MKKNKREKKHPKHRRRERRQYVEDLDNTKESETDEEDGDEYYHEPVHSYRHEMMHAYDPYDLKGVTAPWLQDGDRKARDEFRVKYYIACLPAETCISIKCGSDRYISGCCLPRWLNTFVRGYSRTFANIC